MLSLYLESSQNRRRAGGQEGRRCLPVVVDGLDDEAEGGAHGVDVLAHDLLDDGGLACIVEAAASWSTPVYAQVRMNNGRARNTASICEAPCP
jgi:hypothetical protein